MLLCLYSADSDGGVKLTAGPSALEGPAAGGTLPEKKIAEES